MHLSDEVAHIGELIIARLDHDIDPATEDVELGVGYEDTDLYQSIAFDGETCHLAVDPDDVLALLGGGHRGTLLPGADFLHFSFTFRSPTW